MEFVELFKDITIYIDIVMLFTEEVSRMSKSGYSDMELLEYMNEHFDEDECELNEEEYKEPKKCDSYFCMGCKLRKTVDYERSTLVCTRCGQFEYYPIYVSSYNHTMQPSRRKCIYKRYDNFNPISTGLFCLVVALGGVFSTPFHNSFVFKVRLLKFCTEILSDKMNNLR